jgi:hypothetical protein
VSSAEKAQWLNRTKMLVYLMCQLMETLEAQDTSSTALVTASAARGRGKKNAGAADAASYSRVSILWISILCIISFLCICPWNQS